MPTLKKTLNPFADWSLDEFCEHYDLTQSQVLQEIAEGHLAGSLLKGQYVVSLEAHQSWYAIRRGPHPYTHLEECPDY